MASRYDNGKPGDPVGCERFGSCDFIRSYTLQLPRMAEVLSRRYCKGNWRACARHMVAESLGAASVPGDLFPTSHERATRIIRGLE